jgi:hypothetical protein
MRPLVATGLLALLSLTGACGTAAPVGTADTAISAADTAGADVASCTPLLCSNATVCTIAGTCAPMFPHKYVFILQKAILMSYGSDGNPWDTKSAEDEHGKPDTYVQVMVDGKEVCLTSVVADELEPVWNKECAVTLAADSEIHFAVYDRDKPAESADALMSDLAVSPDSKAHDIASELRNGAGQWKDSTVTLFVAIKAP